MGVASKIYFWSVVAQLLAGSVLVALNVTAAPRTASNVALAVCGAIMALGGAGQLVVHLRATRSERRP